MIGTEKLRDEGKTNLHLSFLPYEQELRRQIIGVVCESSESAPKKSESKAPGTIKQGTKAAPGQKKGPKAAAAEGEKGEANMRPRRKKGRRPDAASKANG